MSDVLIRGLRKTFPGRSRVVAIDDLDLHIEQGELLVLLGPSGCGKTTTLRALAGLETADAGSISFGDRVVFDAPTRVNVAPERRAIGMVFQSYALWPHKTVRANIAYPLRARRMHSELREHGWVEAAAAMVDCAALLDRYPAQLSGGQQQRVALARGIVARPEVVLFDEPLSNLDARLRDQVRGELRALHRRIGFTGVFVTHDQSEALALGDRLAVMRAGRLEQLGTPTEVFHEPATEYVADFVGFLDRVVVRRSDGAWRAGHGELVGLDLPDDLEVGAVHVRVRPSDVRVLAARSRLPGHAHLDGAVVSEVLYMGEHSEMLLEVDGLTMRANVGDVDRRTLDAKIGDQVTLAFDPARSRVFDGDGRLLRPGVPRS